MADTELNYGNDSLDTIDGERNQVRSRPSIYFGTDDVYGALNAVLEIVTNSTDEASTGNGDKIIIEVDDDYNVKVTDYGRGVPLAWNEGKKQWNWHIVFNRLYGSGKYNAAAYANAAGLNGVGAAITQFTSLYLKVISRRMEHVALPGGKTGVEYNEYEMNFEDGYPKGKLITRKWNPAEHTTGTEVSWKTDPAVFQDTKFDVEDLLFKLRRLATISGGVHYVVRYKNVPELDIYFEKGPITFLEQMPQHKLTADIIEAHGKVPTTDYIKGKAETFDVTADVYFTFCLENPMIETYHNNAFMIEHGTSCNGCKQAIAQIIESHARKANKIGAKDRINVSDVEDVMLGIVSTKFRGDFSSFDGQDKKAIKNMFLTGVVRQVVADAFNEWVSLHSDEMSKIIEAVLTTRAAKDRAAAVKKNAIKKLSEGISSFKNRPTRLVDCEWNAAQGNELYLVEGESAKGSTVFARNAKMQAVYPLTGKILNCDKATPEIIFNNKVVLELCQIVGCGVELESKYIKGLPKFDITKMNYSKIIINTDADLDGWHIQCLLLVFFYKLMPSIIRAGRLYIAEAPLYWIKSSGNKDAVSAYAYTEQEKDKLLAELKKAGFTKPQITRFKGLGEMEPEQMAESTMDITKRRLTLVEWPADTEAFEKVMHELLGEDIVARKEWITDYFELNKEEAESYFNENDEEQFVAAELDG